MKFNCVNGIAVVATVACALISLRLQTEIVGTGFAIGAWTGLPGYEQRLSEAQLRSQALIHRLLIIQLMGGIGAFLAYPRKLAVKWGVPFVLGFSLSMYVLFWLLAEVIAVLH